MGDPRGSGDIAEWDELQRLRRRAYGPDADIAEDATSQARLAELEAAHHRRQSPTADVDDDATAGIDHDAGPEFAPGSRPVGSAPAAAWWRRRRFMILGCAVVALSVNAVVVAVLSQWLAGASAPPTAASTEAIPPLPAGREFGSYDAAPDYALGVRSIGAEIDQPTDRHGTLDALGMSADELLRYENFETFNIWSGESSHGLTCLLVAVPVQGLREGLSGDGCSLRGLDASVDIPSMRGGMIRFVLREDHVNVYLYETGTDPNAPAR